MLIVDGTLVPTRDHHIAEKSKNYRYSTNHQVIVDADTPLVVAVGHPVPGNRNDCKAWAESGAKAAAGRTTTIADGGYAGTTLVIPHRRPAAGELCDWKFDLDEYAFTGLRAGASGFLLKNVRTEELLAGIRTVAGGDAVLAPSTTRRLLDIYAGTFHATAAATPPKDVLAALTQRERQVFTEMASGRTNQEIADRLVLSETTVKTHVTRVLAKLNLRDRIQTVIFAYENGLSTPSR